MDTDGPQFIPGIYNYCDRWCERCTFTARCRVFADLENSNEEDRDINNKNFWVNISESFQTTAEALQEKAAEFGIDLDAIYDEEIALHRKKIDDFVGGHELSQMADKYAHDAAKILDENEHLLRAHVIAVAPATELLEILHWYQPFIPAKVRRALTGIMDENDEESAEQINDPESDPNGSIKAALIAMDRSIMAWGTFTQKNTAPLTMQMMGLLTKLRNKCEEKFPLARDFIRPGFDELEGVM